MKNQTKNKKMGETYLLNIPKVISISVTPFVFVVLEVTVFPSATANPKVSIASITSFVDGPFTRMSSPGFAYC